MSEISKLKQRAVYGAVSYALRTGFLYGVSIIATGLLGAYLSPSEFGTYFIVTSMIGIFTFMSDVGLAATLVQKKTDPTLEELRTTFSVQQFLALGIFILSLVLTPVWISLAHLSRSGLWLLYALSFSFCLASLKTIPSILLERKLEFGKLVMPQIAETIVFYGVAVLLAIKGFGVTSYTVAVIARSIVGVVSIYMLQQWRIGISFSRNTFRELVGFGAKFQLNDLLARIKDDLFIVLLAKFLPASEMGLIGWAKKWSMFPYQMSVNSVVSITFPTYSRLQHDHKRLGRAIEISIFFISLLIFPVLAGMTIMAWPLTQLLPSYHKWQPAIISLGFFCFNIAWSAVSTPLTNTLNAIGRISTTLKLMVMWTALTWIVTPVCVWFFGMNGVAIASAIIGMTSIVTIYLVKQLLDVRFVEQIWRQLIASIIMLAYLGILNTEWSKSFMLFAGGVVSGGLVYIICLMLFGYKKIRTELVAIRAK